MAQILSFPSVAPRDRGAMAPEASAGDVVAMHHIDLDTVIETIRVLRDVGRGHLLDAFNGRSCGATEAAALLQARKEPPRRR